MTVATRLALAPGVRVSVGSDRLTIEVQERLVELPPDPGLSALVQVLLQGERSLAAIEQAHDVSDVSSRAELRFWLEILERAGCLKLVVRDSATLLLTRVRIGHHPQPALPSPVPGETYRMSPFAYGRWQDDALSLMSPLSEFSVTLHAADAFASLWRLRAYTAPATRSYGNTLLATVADILIAARMLVPEGGLDADVDRYAASWDFHDLLFQTHTRYGRWTTPYGRNAASSHAVVASLPRDSVRARVQFERSDRPWAAATVAEALDARRSVRVHGPQPLSRAALAMFLESTLAERADGGRPHRAYPSAGSLYLVDAFVAVARVEDIEPGLYRYDALNNQLIHIRGFDTWVAQCIHSAAALAGGEGHRTHALIALTIRNSVVAPYRRVGFANILKEVGAIYQTMYMVAAAMDLAACALGGGNADAFAAMLGDYFEGDMLVGEFLLGRP